MDLGVVVVGVGSAGVLRPSRGRGVGPGGDGSGRAAAGCAPMTIFALCLDAVAVLVFVHTVVNAMLLRRPPASGLVREPVSVLVPVRDEATRVGACLRALLDQRDLADVEVLVYDDASTDGTADLLQDMGIRVLTGPPPAPTELGKPLACARLAAAARGDVLVFVDA